ncbi:uridine kinase family protein [Pedobacter deserti]|uniref:uridine kinase family protein n=1 Tax=Pedobacter deserti TaxID=2817382 RepID=UPI00210CD376|nr:uridine kinase [Pedobacter sp. SYSU D00382]
MRKSNKPFIIGIAGGSGSGKTFFLKSFLNHFKPGEVTLVSQDDYYIDAGVMSMEENKLFNFDLPSAIDHKQFVHDISKLVHGEIVYKKEYNFNNPLAVVKTLEIKPAPVLIIEGLFILHFQDIAALLDHSIFIEAKGSVALQRRISRDDIERGYPKEDVLYKWHNHVVPAYKEYLLPYKSSCHRIVVNNDNTPEKIIELTDAICRELKLQQLNNC